MATTVAVSMGIATAVETPSGRRRIATSFGQGGIWTVTLRTQTGATFVESARDPRFRRNWGPEQAAGPPDTPFAGDFPTAWASKSRDDLVEWLILEYPQAVVPAAVHVVETHNPGALVKVSMFTTSNEEVVLFEGQDPTATDAQQGVSIVDVQTELTTKRIKIYLDSPSVAGLNEIDAVGLVDRGGQIQWATHAKASTTFARVLRSDPNPQELIPRWGGLHRSGETNASGEPSREVRAAAGFGWPLLAMWGPYDISSTPGALSPGGRTFTRPLARRSRSVSLPYRPIWIGFILNTLIYGFALQLSRWMVTRPQRFLREVMRMRRGSCPQCGYNLRYDFAAGCPECGWLR